MLGTAMQGERAGQAIQSIPSTLTNWKSWKENFPKTTVMALPQFTQFYTSRCYQGNLGKHLIGTKQPGHAPKAWRYDQLTHEPVVNDNYAGQPIVVMFQESVGSATIFQRQIDGETLEFNWQKPNIVDKQSGSIWDPLTGIAVSGPRQGQRLKTQISIPCFSDKWEQFHNDSEYWSVALPLFFSTQITENISAKCEEISHKHVMELYHQSLGLKNITREKAKNFFNEKR